MKRENFYYILIPSNFQYWQFSKIAWGGKGGSALPPINNICYNLEVKKICVIYIDVQN